MLFTNCCTRILNAQAAYLTVVSTSALIPFEVYELIEGTTVPKIILLMVNVVIVLYLIKQLKQHTLRRA